MGNDNTRAEGKRRHHGGGRSRTGQLVWRKRGWAARFWTVIDGERVRVQRDLETSNKAVARRKLARLLESENPTPAEAARSETFAEAAKRIVQKQKDEGLRTWKERWRRLERFAFPEFGNLDPREIRPAHVREVLEGAAGLGRSRSTVHQLKVDVSSVLGELWRDEVLPENVAARVRIPKSARVDGRDRVILTDEEFARFMACRDVDGELHTMALVSRCYGGARTSDLHGWRWEQIDTVHWIDAHIPRPKTKTKDRIMLPPVLVPLLQAWWHGGGKRTEGPVFPVREGKRAGQHKRQMSYAKALRRALWQAGIVRPLPGYEAAASKLEALRNAKAPAVEIRAAELAAQKLCLIQAGSEDFRRLDFHSFRRAFNTALGAAGVNVQQAMALAGHRTPQTHLVYVKLAQRGALETPTEALPVLQKAPAAPFALPPANDSRARPVGFEPTTLGFEVRCSIQLS